MRMLLQPVDTFFFRNHRPLNAGEDAVAAGIFPPYPGTLYGSLRSTYIHAHGGFERFYQGQDTHLLHWMGTPSQVGDFSLKGFYLYDGGPVLPLPLDYQVVSRRAEQQTTTFEETQKRNTSGSSDKQSGEQALPLQLRHESDGYTSNRSAYRLYGTSQEKSAAAAGGYVDFENWKRALIKYEEVPVFRASRWLQPEYRLGIMRNRHTNRTESGMLYQMEMQRFKVESDSGDTAGLCVICREAPDFRDVGLARLGGENRPWSVSVINDAPLFTEAEEAKLIENISRNCIVRVVLLTPAIWGQGSRPNCWDKTTNQLKLASGLHVDVLAAVIGRPHVIGGWDMAKGRPKQRQFAVPAGSVLYLKVKPEQIQPLIETLHAQPLTDDLAHEGYGWAVCGAYSGSLNASDTPC